MMTVMTLLVVMMMVMTVTNSTLLVLDQTRCYSGCGAEQCRDPVVGAGQVVRAVNWTLERMQTSDPDKIYPGQLSHTLLLLNIILSVFIPVSKAIRYLNLVLKTIKNQGQGPNYFQSSLLESPWLQ